MMIEITDSGEYQTMRNVDLRADGVAVFSPNTWVLVRLDPDPEIVATVDLG